MTKLEVVGGSRSTLGCEQWFAYQGQHTKSVYVHRYSKPHYDTFAGNHFYKVRGPFLAVGLLQAQAIADGKFRKAIKALTYSEPQVA